jgi:polyphosphate kinase
MKKGGKEMPWINRDISWLSFNDRVLQEASDPGVPLLERIKFLGIFSNNLDEFFRVRVGSYRRMMSLGKNMRYFIGEDPRQVLEKIQKKVLDQQERFSGVFEVIKQELRHNGILLVNEKQLTSSQGAWVKEFFHQTVRPLLVPIMIESAPKIPTLRDKSIYLAVKLSNKTGGRQSLYSLVEVPDEISRFVLLPSRQNTQSIMLLDDVIRYCLEDIYAMFEYKIFEAWTIKLTRDADFDIDSDFSKSITEKIARGLRARKIASPVRFVYDDELPADFLAFLMKKMGLGKQQALIPGGRYHNFKDFIKFPAVGGSSLRNPPFMPVEHPLLRENRSLFEAISKEDILLCYPYQSFDHLIDFLREAAMDPHVSHIRITMYRAARYSKVINALVNAIRNGKQVTAVIELQARFDEQANLNIGNYLQEEGARVIYGVPGLKVHSKLILITRKENGKSVHYTHVGTGNFNEDTARIYSDFSLFTRDARISDEVEKVFHFYANNYKIGTYKHLLVSPFFMRKKLMKLIEYEIKQAKAGKKAGIFMKMNSLVDNELTEALYQASEAGVEIRLIIRGICSLVPGIKGFSTNIKAVSLVDKYLEHARVCCFHHGGEELVFIGSADMMIRNLDYRSEIACPVYNPSLKKVIMDVLTLQWNGSTKIRILNKELDNTYRQPDNGVKVRAQDEIYKYFSSMIEKRSSSSKAKSKARP